MEIYKRTPVGSGSAPGTPTSTTRKAAQVLALQLQSPRSSFTSSCPSTTNHSQTQAQSHSQPATPPRQSSSTPKVVHSAQYSNSSAEVRTAPTPLPPAPATSPVVSNRPFAHLKVSTAPLEPAPQGSGEFARSTLSPSNRVEQAQKRQVLITSLFPRSMTLQDTTGIADIHFPTEESAGNTAEAYSVGCVDGFEGLTISGHAMALKPASSELDRRYVAELAELDDELEEEGSEPEDSGSNSSASSSDEEDVDDAVWQDAAEDDVCLQQTASLDASNHEHPRGNEGSDFSDTDQDELDCGETRTNPDASLRSRSDSTSSSDSGSSVSSTSAGADDEHAAVRKTSSASSGVQHILPTSNTYLQVKQSELYSESDEGSDFHQNMQKFIQNFHESQNNSFKLDISDSEIEPSRRSNTASADIAATNKRPTGKKTVANKNKALVKSDKLAPSGLAKKSVKR